MILDFKYQTRLRNNQGVKEEWKGGSNLWVRIMKDNCLVDRYEKERKTLC